MITTSYKLTSKQIPDYPSKLKLQACHNYFLPVIGVTIGFEENNTVILENRTLPELCLKVLEGDLRRTTVVNVAYQDGSTTGE